MAATAARKLNRHKRQALLAAPIALLAGILFYLASWDEPPIDVAKAFPRGEIIVGVDASFPPFAADDGISVYGLDIDLAKSIAAILDMPLRLVNIGYYGLYDALLTGEVDLLVSALRVNSAYMDDVRYTRSYFDNGLVLIHRAGEEAPLKQLSGQRIAYEFGSSADEQLRKLEREIGQVQQLPYELPSYALDSLRLFHADAALVDNITYRLYRGQHPDWQSSHLYLTHDLYAIAIDIDRPDAYRLVDDVLSILKESGQLDTIVAKWLNDPSTGANHE